MLPKLAIVRASKAIIAGLFFYHPGYYKLSFELYWFEDIIHLPNITVSGYYERDSFSISI